MAEEIDDSGFYLEDFSTESEWEIFNAQLCEILQKWVSSTSDSTYDACNDWLTKVEVVKVLGKEICLRYYEANVNDSNTNAVTSNTSNIHSNGPTSFCNSYNLPFACMNDEQYSQDYTLLGRIYDLQEFVLVHPVHNDIDYLKHTSEFNFYMSAISVVAGELRLTFPIFLQIHKPKWNYFLGVGLTNNKYTNYKVVAVRDLPPEYYYLSGLLKMFKEKLLTSHKETAVVSVKNTYTLDPIKLRAPMYLPFSMMSSLAKNDSIISVSEFIPLPHGYFPDSRCDLLLICIWPEATETLLIDSVLQTQFCPAKAEQALLQMIIHSNSYLTACLKDFLILYSNECTQEMFVGNNHIKHTSMSSNRQRKLPKTSSGPMNENELNQMLCYLFPHMNSEKALFPYKLSNNAQEVRIHNIKTASPDSLILRLSSLLATCNAHYGGGNGLWQLWSSFVRELRYLWENNTEIPGIASGFPDLKTCLLHQKLQMLNLCLKRKLQEPYEGQCSSIMNSVDDSDENDEFFDCIDLVKEAEIENEFDPNNIKMEKISKPEGRLKRFDDNIKLLNADDYLYIPITQDPVPKTEDQLQEDAEMLTAGSSADTNSHVVFSTLLSDMEAFKSANPNAIFEDFIRWYSPKDFLEFTNDEGKQDYKLTFRMAASENTWQKMWKQAKPVPAFKQKPLFDYNNEAVKVLNYLENCSIGNVCHLTVIPLLYSALLKLKNIFINSKNLDVFGEDLNDLFNHLSNFSNELENASDPCLHTFDRFLKDVEDLENQFYLYKCFEQISPAIGIDSTTNIIENFRNFLKNNHTYEIVLNNTNKSNNCNDMDLVNNIPTIFQTIDADIPPISKDYIIRSESANETNGSVYDSETDRTSQFLRAIVTKGCIRLSSAFTENTTFF